MPEPRGSDRVTISAREFGKRENVDEKEVRRAVEAGRLQVGDNGRPFADQVRNGWHQPRRGSAKFAENVRENGGTVADKADPDRVLEQAGAFAEDVLAGRFLPVVDAIAAKENALALKHLLEARRRAGSQVDLQAVKDALFKRARGERDNLLNWPGRVAPLIAADLGIEPDRLAELLTEHVHQLLVDLGAPELDLDGDTNDIR